MGDDTVPVLAPTDLWIARLTVLGHVDELGRLI
jgi:hypothetical protein